MATIKKTDKESSNKEVKIKDGLFILSFVEDANQLNIFINDIPFGNTLTDNYKTKDDYRYHDIFHFSYAVHLGWSPCVRKLMGWNIKQNSIIDEIGDGGKATAVEESISLLTFTYAKELNHFAGSKEIPDELFGYIQRLTHGLKVASKTKQEWEDAIFSGYAVFRELVQNKGGNVLVNFTEKQLNYIGKHQ
jgi:hypothetical protein